LTYLTEESRALADLLRRTIDADHFPLSPRVRTLQAILDKIEPPPVREPVPLPTEALISHRLMPRSRPNPQRIYPRTSPPSIGMTAPVT